MAGLNNGNTKIEKVDKTNLIMNSILLLDREKLINELK